MLHACGHSAHQVYFSHSHDGLLSFANIAFYIFVRKKKKKMDTNNFNVVLICILYRFKKSIGKPAMVRTTKCNWKSIILWPVTISWYFRASIRDSWSITYNTNVYSCITNAIVRLPIFCHGSPYHLPKTPFQYKFIPLRYLVLL